MTRLMFLALVTVLLSSAASAGPGIVGDYAPMFVVRAEYLMDKGRHNDAVAALSPELGRIRDQRIKHQVYAILCRAHLIESRAEQAQEACGRALASPSLATWSDYSNRGASHYLLGHYAAAMADFERAAQLNPQSQEVSRNVSAAARRLSAPSHRLATQDARSTKAP